MTTDTNIDPPPASTRALSYPDFRAYILQRLLSTLAISTQSVVVGWQVYDLTHQAFSLGLVGLMQFVPVILLSLVAGHTADKYDRRHILMLSIGVQLLCSAGFITLSLLHNTSVVPIYLLLLLFGTARAFLAPATQSVIPRLVHRDALGSAIALGSSIFMVASIAGPSLGGLLYGLGPAIAYGVSALFFAASLCASGLIKVNLRPEVKMDAGLQTVLAGVRFIKARPAILGAISLDLFAVLLGGATALLPVYARDILTVGPIGLGFLRAGPAIGAFVTALFLAHRSMGRHAGAIMFWAVALFGIATIVFGVSTYFPLSLAALIVLGASDMVSVNVRSNLIQRSTPDEMRGRVAAVSWVFISASNELGEMESGFTAALFGSAPAAVMVGGVGTLVVTGLWAWLFPALRKVSRLEEIEAG
jgi:MFS family permease